MYFYLWKGNCFWPEGKWKFRIVLVVSWNGGRCWSCVRVSLWPEYNNDKVEAINSFLVTEWLVSWSGKRCWSCTTVLLWPEYCNDKVQVLTVSDDELCNVENRLLLLLNVAKNFLRGWSVCKIGGLLTHPNYAWRSMTSAIRMRDLLYSDMTGRN